MWWDQKCEGRKMREQDLVLIHTTLGIIRKPALIDFRIDQLGKYNVKETQNVEFRDEDQ